MATRSLTEGFTFMRNNALQNRQFYSDQGGDDREALVTRGRDADIELGHTASKLPPEWIGGTDEIQFEFSRIKQKMKELISLHDRHLNRASLDESVDEERAIEIQTKEITQMFSRAHKLLTQLSARRIRATGGQEAKMAGNIQSSLARSLQDLSTAFRKAQSGYLQKLKSRDERFSQYFEIPPEYGVLSHDDTDGLAEYYDRGFTALQTQLVEDNTMVVTQREQEISQILKSIHELNEIFRDLAQLVVDQGTLVDRIDYNTEQTQTRVKEGLKQLQKAEKYQKKNRKMLVIVILAVIVVVLTVILIASKFS